MNDSSNLSVCKNQLKNLVNNKIIGNNCKEEFINLERDDIILVINDLVAKVNNIVFHTYNFIKLYLLYLYDNKQPFPLIDDEVVYIIMCIISIRTETTGRKPTPDKQLFIEELSEFCYDHYRPLLKDEDIVINDKLSYILSYECTDIVKNINNNIKEHFVDHVRKYVNDYFDVKGQIECIKCNKKLTDSQQKEQIRNLTSIYKKIKYDFLSLGQEYQSDEEYHDWIYKTKHKIMPRHDILKYSYFYDVEVQPQKYLHSMITINRLIQKLNKDNDSTHKLFNVVPLRTSIVPKYITIDNCALNSIFYGRAEYFQYTSFYGPMLWSNIFNLKSKGFKRSGYKFTFMIKTDGVGCSILFEKLTEEEKQAIKISRINANPLKIDNGKQKIPTKKDKNKRRKSSKKSKKDKKKEKSTKNNAFQYIEEVQITTSMKKKRIVAIDPGHNDLINCLMECDPNGRVVDEIKYCNNEISATLSEPNDITFRYTRCQRNRESKTIRYRKIDKRLKNKKIIELETNMSKFNSKTCHFKEFKDYLFNKIALNRTLKPHYEQEIYRKLKLNRYINTQKSETKMLKNFEKAFGSPYEVIIVFGDYDKKGTMKGSEPHIAKRLKKLFAEYGYTVYLIDEYNTSKLCNKCSSETERFMWLEKEIKDKKTGKKRIKNVLLWKLLRCTSEKCATHHNRDHNAARNFLKIVKSVFANKGRPKKYIREKEPINQPPKLNHWQILNI